MAKTAKKKKTIRTIPQLRTRVRELDPQVRVKNFEEVNCGYSLDEALNEAERCLLCPDSACIAGCPVNINIPKFIEALTAKDVRGAYDVITASNLLASVCGRVCPQETQCEGVCIVGETLEPVAIGRLERFVGDTAIKEKWSNVPDLGEAREQDGHRGSGPAGMACAADMAKAGCEVTVFEAFHQAGGVLKYGIPDFRLPNTVVGGRPRHRGALVQRSLHRTKRFPHRDRGLWPGRHGVRGGPGQGGMRCHGVRSISSGGRRDEMLRT